jgi:ribosomal protein S18 acetylase RimI-like enzyme
VILRCVNDDELEQLKRLRLRALLDAPSAFGSTHAEEADRVPQRWQSWLTDACTFVIEDPLGWHGIAAVFMDASDRRLCHLVSMWIAPSHRGRGLGGDLLAAGIEWGRKQGAHQIHLGVVEGNSAALHLYRRAGFEPTGRRELLRSDPSKTVIYMSLDIRETPE